MKLFPKLLASIVLAVGAPAAAALAQQAIQLGAGLDSLFTTGVQSATRSREGNAVVFKQNQYDGVLPPNYNVAFDNAFRPTVTPLPPTPAYAPPPANLKEWVLATLADGTQVVSNANKTKQSNGYGDSKALDNLYLARGTKRKLVWTGAVCPLISRLRTLVTPDEKALIWEYQGGETRRLNLETGEVRTLLPPQAQWSYFDDHWAATNQYLVVGGKTEAARAPYSLLLVDLQTGAVKSRARLTKHFSVSLLGSHHVFALSPDDHQLLRFRIADGRLADSTRVWIGAAGLPLAALRGSQGAWGYGYVPMSEETVLIYPTAPVKRYFTDNPSYYNPAMVLYNLTTGTVEKAWPYILKGAPDRAALYAAFRTKKIAEPAPVVAAAEKPLNSTERCELHNKARKWPVGTSFERGEQRVVLMGFECYDGSYTYLNLSWNRIGKYWATSKGAAREAYFLNQWGTPIPQKHAACGLCNATGVVNKKKVYTRESRVVQLNFTEYVRTPTYELHTTENVTCDQCKGEGWIP